jgi:hypothetical protein
MTIGTVNVSFNEIQIELGRASASANMSINEAEAGAYATLKPCQPGPVVRTNPSGTTPNTVFEWFGYDHSYVVSECFSVTLATGTDYTNACDNYASNINKSTYYVSGSGCNGLAASCQIYSTQCCTGTVSIGYYSNGTDAFSYDGGVTDGGTSCAPPPPPPPFPPPPPPPPPRCSCVEGTCSLTCDCPDRLCSTAADCNAPCL